MSEKLAQLEKKGSGELKETVLWTNPSPTSVFPSSGTYSDITLSQAYDNFKALRFYYKLANTGVTELYVDIQKELITNTASTTDRFAAAIIARYSNRNYAREIIRLSTTSLRMTLGYGINAQVNSNVPAVPTKICGLK